MQVYLTNQSPEAYQDIASSAAGLLARPTVLSGSTQHFTVFCMPNLLPLGSQVAVAVLARCENDYQCLATWFGIRPSHFNVTLAGLSTYLDGTGGAFHSTCDSADIYADVKFNPILDPQVSSAFVVAEATEVFSAILNNGWDCGASNGEGLSRVLASDRYPKVLDFGATAGAWLYGGRPDWINNTNYTDRDSVSNGCSVLFLNWMNTVVQIGWDQICQAGGDTLIETFTKITGRNTGFREFMDLVNTRFPANAPVEQQVKVDNPFLPQAP